VEKTLFWIAVFLNFPENSKKPLQYKGKWLVEKAVENVDNDL
jgi:hypothetical protein